MSLALITGSGLEGMDLGPHHPRTVKTPYGLVTVEELEATAVPIFVLPRHGREHGVPPHRINYRANIAAVHLLECRQIIATNAVGSLRSEMPPGAYVLPDQFIDFTHGRVNTFYDGDGGRVRHVDVTQPYCERLRRALQTELETQGRTVHPTATYLCTEGPRFETPAEIRMFAQWGADLVGMTGVPEVVLAREAGLCYASLCLVTNMAAGISRGPITEGEVTDVAHRCLGEMQQLLEGMIAQAAGEEECCC
jgi:5'-methylthioadenosine phosphorylase